MRKFLLSLILFFCMFISISAQSQFLEKGHYGIMAVESTIFTEYNATVGGTFAISILGSVDLGVSGSNFRTNDLYGTKNSTAMEVYTNIYVSRKKTNLALHVGIVNTGGTSGFAVGFGGNKNFQLSNNVKLQPSLSFALLYFSGSKSVTTSSSLSVSFDFLFYNHIIVSPGVGYSNQSFVEVLSIGALLGF